MPLLVDRLRSGDFEIPFDHLGADPLCQKDTVVGLLQHAVILEATNVAEWFYADNTQDFWDYREDYPNLAPPWQVFWIECRRPSVMRAGNEVISSQDRLPDRWGVLFIGERTDEGWVLNGLGFMEHQRRCMGPLFDFKAEIDADGKWVHHPGSAGEGRLYVDQHTTERGWGFMSPIPVDYGEETAEVFIKSVDSLALAPLMAISFAHCRNVERSEHRPPPKVSKKYQKRHGVLLVKHYTLQIGRMTKAVSDASSSGGTRREALHIVRGHFKTYSDEAPLMGKHSGTFFWADHVRGDSDAGEVIKDYQV